LIEAGAAVNEVDNYRLTALIHACDSGYHECAQALIEAGAAVNAVDNDGSTALIWACGEGHLECALTVIGAGAALDKVSNNGTTALMYACNMGHHECTQALIDAQADLELPNRDGQNALMIACKSPPSYYPQRVRPGRIRCALALLEATAPIREADFSDKVASLKFAVERLQLIEAVLASVHVIEDAPPLASVRDLQTDARGFLVSFASDMLANAKLPKRRRRSRRLAAKRLTGR